MNYKSTIEIYCLKHSITTKTSVINYKKSKFGVFCCSKEKQSLATSLSNKKRKKFNLANQKKVEHKINYLNNKTKQQNKVKQKIKQNNHILILDNYKNVHSLLTIYCPKHKYKTLITFRNYERNSYGLRCCSRYCLKY